MRSFQRTAYEYKRLEISLIELTELNELGSKGWRVVTTYPSSRYFGKYEVLLEKEYQISSGPSIPG
jgi:hypothetical protein